MENITKKKLKKNWQKFKKEILDENESNEGKSEKIESIKLLFDKSNEKNIISSDNLNDSKSILYLLKQIILSESSNVSFQEQGDYYRMKRLIDGLDVNGFLGHNIHTMGGYFNTNIINKEKSIKYFIKLIEDEITFLKKKDNSRKFGWLIKDIRNLIIGILIAVIAGLILYILIGSNN